LRILEETVEAVRALWTEETVDYKGEYVRLDGAFSDPKPVQPRPELWIGGGGEQVTLRIAARHADKTNWQVGLDEVVHKSEVGRAHCDRGARAFDTIVRTRGPDCCLFDSERELDAWRESPAGGHLRKLVA